MKNIIMALVVNILFLIVGVSGLFWPQKIQEYMISCDQDSFIPNPFINWIKKPQYITLLRITGGVAMFAFFTLSYVLIKK